MHGWLPRPKDALSGWESGLLAEPVRFSPEVTEKLPVPALHSFVCAFLTQRPLKESVLALLSQLG